MDEATYLQIIAGIDDEIAFTNSDNTENAGAFRAGLMLAKRVVADVFQNQEA